MNMDEIKAIAKERGISSSKLKKSDLVNRLQLAEGNEACYNTGRSAVCAQESCLWRDDCK
jgi:hypothetical protein